MYQTIINLLQNKKIAILGFGIEGKSTYKFIRRYLQNQQITIIDKNDVSTLDLLQNDCFIDFVSGENYLLGLEKYDLIIKSPGITFKDIDITDFEDKITSQLELLLTVSKDNVIGITGTKGKSTTSALLYQVLKDQREDVYLLGNIGNPILDDIENFSSNSLLVVEMSSHQLEFINVSPHYGVVLNLFEDHLDHAGSVKHYHECKMNMFKYQDNNDIGIYGSSNEELSKQVNENQFQGNFYKFQENNQNIDAKTAYIDNNNVMFQGEKLYNIDSPRKLVGVHNLKNIMAVLLISRLLNLDINKAIKVIANFNSLPHRLEYVGTHNEVIYYNDTIATIPEATIEGVKSLKNVNTLIFGGMDRGINYEKLIDFLENCDIENIICMPTTGTKIGKQLKTSKNIVFVETLEEAVQCAKSMTRKNMICLLSPAAPSYEYYKNFEAKGEAYQNLLKKYNQ